MRTGVGERPQCRIWVASLRARRHCVNVPPALPVLLFVKLKDHCFAQSCLSLFLPAQAPMEMRLKPAAKRNAKRVDRPVRLPPEAG
jgi:hypothetical protein